MEKLREVETVAAQRLRKTFKYPSESDDEDAVEAGTYAVRPVPAQVLSPSVRAHKPPVNTHLNDVPTDAAPSANSNAQAQTPERQPKPALVNKVDVSNHSLQPIVSTLVALTGGGRLTVVNTSNGLMPMAPKIRLASRLLYVCA